MSSAKVIRNTFVIFLLSGLWHGANWTFVAWGAFHALLFLPLILTGKNRKYTNQIAEGRLIPSLKEMCQMLVTFLLVVIGWILFRAESIEQAWGYIHGIFNMSLFTAPWLYRRSYYLPVVLSILVLLIVEWVQRDKKHAFDFRGIKSHVIKYFIYMLVVGALFWLGGHAETFIYFQF